MYIKTLNQLPGSYFSSYLTGLADHQMTPHLAYAWAFQIVSHNQSRSSKYIITMHLAQNFLCFTFSHPNANSFKTAYGFFLQTHYKRTLSIPGWCGLSSPSDPAAGALDYMPQGLVLFLDKTKDKNFKTRNLTYVSCQGSRIYHWPLQLIFSWLKWDWHHLPKWNPNQMSMTC